MNFDRITVEPDKLEGNPNHPGAARAKRDPAESAAAIGRRSAQSWSRYQAHVELLRGRRYKTIFVIALACLHGRVSTALP
ncbi:hypothetical protein [Nonomuraea sp. NEAU-A123]|uniref:hypothetical protein n=1 Tax=Nonomuraea sp. NEAU-A123 TaxID=2839649 RepID=UPI001BE3D85F|nr:hypothetical protein [Nonomuraea sp. NEAU-A123]MBT2235146.1 hypothetical protein [Nonomuraea sp. NEAU-A123]